MPKQQHIHPGEILLTEFLEPLGVSQYKLAKNIGVSARRINEIVHNDRAITVDTALRFAKFFGNSPQFWLNLQNTYDLRIHKLRMVKVLATEVRSLKLAL